VEANAALAIEASKFDPKGGGAADIVEWLLGRGRKGGGGREGSESLQVGSTETPSERNRTTTTDKSPD
jgi:hypothetical protein